MKEKDLLLALSRKGTGDPAGVRTSCGTRKRRTMGESARHRLEEDVEQLFEPPRVCRAAARTREPDHRMAADHRAAYVGVRRARGVGRVVGADFSAPRQAAFRWAAPDPMEAANFETAGQNDVIVDARRRLVVAVVVVPKADMERHAQQLISTALDLELQEGTVVADRVGESEPLSYIGGGVGMLASVR